MNDEPVIVRGAKLDPDHAYLTEMTPERYAERIDDAIDANVNLLRVWGGGIYESDDFYERCDELGVLVWQDFLFACAAYAEEPWLADEVEPEVREAVTRLSPHPSLVVWNGNNENLVAYAEWGWRPSLCRADLGQRVLPVPAARGRRRARPDPAVHARVAVLVRRVPAPERRSQRHRAHLGRLEHEGLHRVHGLAPPVRRRVRVPGPPAWSTLSAVVHDEPLDPDGHEMLVHQKAHEGNRKLADGMRGHIPEPRSIEDWHWAAQLNQAHAIRFGMDWFGHARPTTRAWSSGS